MMKTLGTVSNETMQKVPGYPHEGLTINGVVYTYRGL